MRMIDDAWFVAKRLWSVRLAVLGVMWATAAGLWLAVPGEWHPTLSEPVRWVLMAFGTILAAMPGIAALVHQPELDAEVHKRKYNPMITAPKDIRP